MRYLKILLFVIFASIMIDASAQYEQKAIRYTSDGIKFLTTDNFRDHINVQRTIVIVEFWAGWNQLNQCTFLKKLSGAKVYRVDMEQSPNIGMKFGITVVPTIVIFDGGKLVKKFEGNLMFQLPVEVDKKKVQKQIDKIIGEKFQ